MTTTALPFDRPVGPQADLEELEYISALQQTDKLVRTDGTIQAIDIRRFLKSRHGIRIDENVIQEQILEEFCGSENDSIDLSHIVTLLMIPYLKQCDDIGNNDGDILTGEKNRKSVELVYRLVVDKALSLDPNAEQQLAGLKHALKFTPKLLQEILESYGVFDIPTHILEQMIMDAASVGGGPNIMPADGGKENNNACVLVTPERFIKVLTKDIALYDTDNDFRASSHLNDIVCSETYFQVEDDGLQDEKKETTKHSDDTLKIKYVNDRQKNKDGHTASHPEEGELEQGGKPPRAGGQLFHRSYTAPVIDYAADNYRSPLWVMLLWTQVLIFYYAYMYDRGQDNFNHLCNHEEFGCRVGISVLSWFVIFLHLTMLGVPFIYFSSLGNVNIRGERAESSHNNRNTMFFFKKVKLSVALMIAFLLMFVASILSFRHEVDLQIHLSTYKDAQEWESYYGVLIIGSCIMVLQVIRLIAIWFPQIENIGFFLFRGGGPFIEMKIKQAATFKVHRMVDHALLMHCTPVDVGSIKKEKKSLSLPPLLFSAANDVVLDAAMKSHIKHRTNSYRSTVDLDENTQLDDAYVEISPNNDPFVHKTEIQNESETSGGIVWTWLRIFNSRLFCEEGLMVHSRLISSNLTQLFVLGFTITAYYYATREIHELATRYDHYIEHIQHKANDYADEAVDGSVLFERIHDAFVDDNNTFGLPFELLNQTFRDFNRTGEELENSEASEDIEASEDTDGDVASDVGNMVDGVVSNQDGDAVESEIGNLMGDLGSAESNAFAGIDANHTEEVLIDAFYDSARTALALLQAGRADDPELLDFEIFYFELPEFQALYNVTYFSNIYTFTRSFGFFLNISDGSFFVNASTLGIIFIDPHSGYRINGTIVPDLYPAGAFLKLDVEVESDSGDSELAQSFYFDEAYYSNRNLLLLIPVWQVYTAVSIGFVFAMILAIYIAVVFIPSYVSSAMKFRTGELRSLRDPLFNTYRKSQEATVTIFGAAFWGSLFSSIACFLLVSFIAFLLVWEATRQYVFLMLSQIVGVIVTIVLKMIAMIFLRGTLFAAFYRKKPAAANFALLALECWNLALTAGFMLARTAIFLITTIFYIGRIDVPMFARGVGTVAGTTLDSYPISFKKDLLIHEAHHHPYIERLGVIYLMKLRYGPRFGTSSGSYWRLLFVLTLMPWMRSYKAGKKLDEDEEEDENNRSASIRPRESSVRERHLETINNMTTTNEALSRELDELRQENDKLRQLLQKANLSSDESESAPPIQNNEDDSEPEIGKSSSWDGPQRIRRHPTAETRASF